MKWIRLEATSGLRIMAPSFSPPPRMEGIDKLFDHPIHARTFHCFRDSVIKLDSNNNKNKNNSGFRCTEEMLVLLQRQPLGGKLGEVTIAVGGTEVSQAELDVLLECAFEAVMRTNNNGVRMIFDMLCTSSSPYLSSLHSSTTTTTTTTTTSTTCMIPSFVPDEVVEYDGLPTGRNRNGEERRVGEWREKYGITFKRNKKSLEARRAAFSRRKAVLYFVAQDVVPVSLLHCRVSHGTKSYGCTSSVADAVHSSPKDIQLLAVSATCACKCLLDVVNHTLTTAFSTDEDSHKQLRQIWSPGSDKPPFISAFSTSGILFASPSFFRLTDHRDRLFISGLAIDQLCRWSVEERQGPRVKTSLVHIHDVLLKCKRSGVLLNILFISIGGAVSCVFGFFSSGDVNEGVLWGAATLRQFVEKHLITPRTTVMLGVRESDKSDSDNTDMDEELHESVISFTPHLLLCMTSLHPTPWFYRILYEMRKVEQEATRDNLFGMHEEPDTSLTMPPKPRERCHYFSLFSNCGKKNSSSVAPRPFVWYTDTVDLPLDLAWCVAASHIVKAEASICTEGRELGHYALFSMISPAAADSTLVVAPTVGGNEGGDGRRYAASWFQHCWRNTCFTDGNGKGENDDHGRYYNSGNNNIPEPDPTRLLQGLCSVGGGPRISLHYEMREKGGHLFHRKNKYEAHTDDDTPAFTSQVTVFPFSILIDENEAESFIVSDAVKGSKTMTAFYALSLQKMKGATHDAVVQEMLLMEGEEIEHEGDVTTMLQKRHGSLSSGDAFAACHEATRHVLEDVWRYPYS